MHSLPARNKKVLIKKIKQYKKQCFPGKGSDARLADEIGVHPTTVSKWLDGSRTPTFSQIYLLANTFNISPLELCGIRRDDAPSQNIADVVLLRSLLDVLEYAEKHGVSLRIVARVMKSINRLLIKEMEEIENQKNDE